MAPTVSIVPFNVDYVEHFRNMNLRWISHYFKVEKMDLFQLEHPEQTIIAVGGEIFFAVENDDNGASTDSNVVLGTVAVIPYGGEDKYEIIKMAVDPAHQGKGVGRMLMERAVEWCKQKKAKEILILSNTVLETAINMYKRSGFQVVHLGAHPDYERCNIVLNMLL